jgi:phosphopantothenoylcysteine decarboxylase/phosphopantothenate--cysteine ligase
VIAPATANFLGKVASGIGDDLLTTVMCATEKPVAIAPSMNSSMYLNPITQKNIEFLKSVGYQFIEPGVGDMACETTGPGRLAEPDKIFKFIENFFKAARSKKKALINKKVLVTAGPCREAIDPVRFISNRSSGKMGYALAEAAREAGAEVTLISGPTGLRPHPAVRLIKVETTEQMYRAVIKEFKGDDILIMAAAPADFKVTKKPRSKLKKDENKSLDLKLIGTTDILAEIGRIKKKNQITVGFALETDDGPANARDKLQRKGLNLIVLNMVGRTVPFEGNRNEVTLIKKGGRPIHLGPATKKEIAEKLLEHIAKLV